MRVRPLLALFFLASLLVAQSPPQRQPYAFFSNLNLADTEQKLNDLAADGYRLIGFQQSLSGASVAVLQDVTSLGEARYEYKLLSGHFQRFINDKHALAPALTAAGAQGYRCVRGSLLNMHPDAWTSNPSEAGFAMERLRNGDNPPVEYRLERASMASHAINDLQRDMHDGFELLMTFSFPGERALLLEKSSAMEKPFDPGAPKSSKSSAMMKGMLWPMTTGASGQGVAIVNFQPKSKNQKLDEQTRRGMHLVALSSAHDSYFSSVFVSEPSLAPPLYVTGELKSRRDTSFRTSAEQWAGVEQQLNAAAAKGYAISLRPVWLNRMNLGVSELKLHYVIPMEATPAKVHYKIISADSLPDLSAAVNSAATEGWKIVPGLFYGDRLVFLEKREPEGQP